MSESRRTRRGRRGAVAARARGNRPLGREVSAGRGSARRSSRALHAAQHENTASSRRRSMDGRRRVPEAAADPGVRGRELLLDVRDEAVGRHHISVCTNISCMLRGAEEIVAHVEKKLGIKRRREHAGRPVLPQAGRGVPRGLQRRADDDGRPRLPREPDAGEGRTGSSTSASEGPQRDRLERPAEPRVLRAAASSSESWKLETYRKIGGYEAWKTILAEKTHARADHRAGEGVGPARPRRRGLPDRR